MEGSDLLNDRPSSLAIGMEAMENITRSADASIMATLQSKIIFIESLPVPVVLGASPQGK